MWGTRNQINIGIVWCWGVIWITPNHCLVRSSVVQKDAMQALLSDFYHIKSVWGTVRSWEWCSDFLLITILDIWIKILFETPIHVKTFFIWEHLWQILFLNGGAAKFASELLLQEVYFEERLYNVCHYVNPVFCKKK